MKLKRLAALFIAVAMTIGMVPSLVFASEAETEPGETAKTETAEPENKEEVPSEAEEDKTPEETASAPAMEAKKAKKQPFKWTWDGTTLTISGDCAMPEPGKNGLPWDSVKADIKKVVIKKGITSICNAAFSKCENLTEASIPSTVKTIGEGAFYCCRKLAKVSIPNGVTSIGQDAFRFCESLTKITIPASIKKMGYWVFGDSGLSSVTIADGVKELGKGAFYCCKNLKTVSIPGSVVSIGEKAFEDCQFLHEVKLHYGLKSIGTMAFNNCTALTSISIPSSVTAIEDIAFRDCTNLYWVYISESLLAKYTDKINGIFEGSTKIQLTRLEDNTFSVTAKTAKVKYKKAKKKAQTIPASKLFNFTDKGQGTYLYAKVKGNKKITVNKTTGKVTVKKKIKKGTYKVKIKVLATGNTTHAASSWKTVTVKIKVK
jgi:hypothetical protein